MNKKDLFYLVVMMVLIIYFFVFDGAGFWSRFIISQKIRSVNRKIEVLESDNTRIAAENEDLRNNRKTWEKKARELGMQKKGEEIYIFKKAEK